MIASDPRLHPDELPLAARHVAASTLARLDVALDAVVMILTRLAEEIALGKRDHSTRAQAHDALVRLFLQLAGRPERLVAVDQAALIMPAKPSPSPFIRACERRWGRFDVDLAARQDNAKAMRFIPPEEDSLSVPWAPYFRAAPVLAWLNPPFADIDPWAAKCGRETHSPALHVRAPSSLRIVMLTPASIGTEWFAEHVHQKALVLGIRPRLTFEGTEGPYPKDLMLSLFGFGAVGFDVWRWS